MAWQDLLGGLAGGLSQGLGQVQQNVEARRRNDATNKELMLRQLQEQRAAEEQARLALMAQFNALEPGVEIDPTDPMVKVAGPGAFVKGPSGKGLTRKKAAAQEQAELGLAEFKLEEPVRAAGRKDALDQASAKSQLIEAFGKEYGPDWRRFLIGNEQVPLQKRQAAATILYGKPEMFMSQGEKLKFSEQVAAAAQTAAAMAPLRQAQAGTIANDDLARMQQLFVEETSKLDPMAKIRYMNDPGAKDREFALWMGSRQKMGVAPPAKILSIEPVK